MDAGCCEVGGCSQGAVDVSTRVGNVDASVPACVNQEFGKNWALYEGDSCEVIKGIPDNSIHFGIHSPPFANLYIYSASMRDMGNCKDMAEFIDHYRYLIREMLRVTIPGRLCAVHCKDLPKYANRDDTAGLIDFPGAIIAAYVAEGWSFHSRVTIWKCPVTERERTNNNGLLHKTIRRDSSQVRQGMADYLLVFRKIPSDGLMSDVPVERPNGIADGYIGEGHPLDSSYHPSPFARKTSALDRELLKQPDEVVEKVNRLVRHFGPDFEREWKEVPAEVQVALSIDIWRRYAEPVWWDIDQTDVLNFELAKGANDERHVCPLQIGLIRRAIQLWSLPGEVVFTPFAGVGSELVGALKEKRRGIGIELHPGYFRHAISELNKVEEASRQKTLF